MQTYREDDDCMLRSYESDMPTIKAHARRELGHLPGVEGVGIGTNALLVYVRDSSVKGRLPATFEGVRLDFVVTGEVSAQ